MCIIFAINWNRMHTQLGTLNINFASKNWARLKYNYYFCAKFLEEIRYLHS